MDVARVIRNGRRAAGLTQAELARRSGTSQPTLSAYERAAVVPSIETLDRLLAACGQRLEVTSGRTIEPVELRKSRALRAAVVCKIAASPADAITRARRNLETMRQADSEGHASRVLDGWACLLDGPIEEIVGVMLSAVHQHRVILDHVLDDEQLAASNPFAGLLSSKERWAVLRGFRAEENAHAA